MVVDTTNTYFYSRLAEMGINETEARQHSLGVDKFGNILQYARHLNGERITYLPKFGSNANKYKKLSKRKTLTNYDLDNLREAYFIKRLRPEYIQQKLIEGQKVPKYLNPAIKKTGLEIQPLFNNEAIDAYNGVNTSGGVMVGIEGYFKSLALSLQGIPSVSFSGITTYKLTQSLRDYLLKVKPKVFIISYDADALQSKSKNGVFSSERVESFHNSVVKFSKSFFDFCKENGLKCKLYFSMLTPEAGEKGMDDLLNGADDLEKENIINSFLTFEDSEYFTFLKLTKKSLNCGIKNLFALSNHRQFYNRFKEEIKDSPFVYKRATYQLKAINTKGDLFNEIETKDRFVLLDNPFFVQTEKETICINEYLGEQMKRFAKLFRKYNRIAINAPTGSGKTSMCIKYLKKSKTLGVIVTPTKLLCEQIAAKYKIHAFHGNCTQKKITEANKQKIIVCTYDTLCHVSVKERTLIVDETHNLINQSNFRKSTLRKVMHQMRKAKNVITISGTQNEMLCKKLGYHFVDVNRLINPAYNVHQVHAYGTLIDSFYSEIDNINFSEGKTHFVFLNDTKKLEDIKDTLVERGVLKAEEIEVISRYHIDRKDCTIYDDIVNKEHIPKRVKLVLCTCMIAEGVNIKNKNIGNIYTIDLKCIDTFRQFAARFRDMKELDIYSILKVDKDLKSEFFTDIEFSTNHKIKKAEVNVYYAEHEKKNLAYDFDENELPYFEDIKPNLKDDKSEFLKYVYFDSEEKANIDLLGIIYDEKQRQISSSNSTYFYTQLEKFGFKMVDTLKECETSELSESHQHIKENKKILKDIEVEEFKKVLITQPEAVVKSAVIRSGNTRSNSSKFYNEFAKDLLDNANENEAKEILERFDYGFKNRWFNGLIRTYCKLHFLGFNKEDIEVCILNYKKENAKRLFDAVKTNIEILAYQKKHIRRHLPPLQRWDAKGKLRIKELINKHLQENDNSIKSTDLSKIINSVFSKVSTNLNTYKQETTYLADFSKDKPFYLVSSLYRLEVVKMCNYKKYKVVEENAPEGENLAKIFSTFFKLEKEKITLNPLQTLRLLNFGK